MSRKKKPVQWVYLVGSPLVTPVKIGTSRNPAQRLADLQVGSPVPLSLLWKTPGTRELERMLHDYFVHYRSHGEWFDFGDLNPIAAVTGALSLFGYRQAVSPAPVPLVQVIEEPEPVVVPAPRVEEPAARPVTNRDRVLQAVRDGARTAKAVVDATGLNKGTVSREIKQLAAAGALNRAEDGTLAAGEVSA